jgi:hypothetical protein
LYVIPTPRCCHSRNAIQHTPTPQINTLDQYSHNGHVTVTGRPSKAQTSQEELLIGFVKFKQLFFFQVFTKRPAPFSSQEKNQLSSSLRIVNLCTDKAEGRH